MKQVADVTVHNAVQGNIRTVIMAAALRHHRLDPIRFDFALNEGSSGSS
jgi:hypothetical protein